MRSLIGKTGIVVCLLYLCLAFTGGILKVIEGTSVTPGFDVFSPLVCIIIVLLMAIWG